MLNCQNMMGMMVGFSHGSKSCELRMSLLHKFKLHHVALGLTPPTASGTFVGPAIIRAEVTVDSSGEKYTGPYTLTMYPGSPDSGTEFNESGTPLVVFTATITAKRVTP